MQLRQNPRQLVFYSSLDLCGDRLKSLGDEILMHAITTTAKAAVRNTLIARLAIHSIKPLVLLCRYR